MVSWLVLLPTCCTCHAIHAMPHEHEWSFGWNCMLWVCVILPMLLMVRPIFERAKDELIERGLISTHILQPWNCAA